MDDKQDVFTVQRPMVYLCFDAAKVKWQFKVNRVLMHYIPFEFSVYPSLKIESGSAVILRYS